MFATVCKTTLLEQKKFQIQTIQKTDLTKLKTIKSKNGDAEYENLLEEYKKIYTGNPNLAKKYAIRSTVLKKQERILRGNFEGTKKSVYNILSQYIAQAVYYDNNPNTAPNADVLQALQSANPNGVKYHVEYKGEGQLVGLFSPAATSNASKYGLDVMLEDGSVGVREFQINDKIDTPIFEFDELKTGVEILAEWDFNDVNDPSKGKKFRKKLEDATRGYLNNGKPKQEQTNFEKLKNSNKILFEEGGLFHDIQVTGIDDPAYSEVDFAKQILTKFNSQPNHLGFAVVSPTGEVKLFAFEIDKLPGSVSSLEGESPQGLGGITIGIPLMFTRGDELQFSSQTRNYTVRLDGNDIVFSYETSESRVNSTRVEVIVENDFNATDYAQAQALVSHNPTLVAILGNPFSSLADPGFRDLVKTMLETFRHEVLGGDQNNAINKLYRYVTSNPQSSINVNVGDLVSTNESGEGRARVLRIEGNQVIVSDGSNNEIAIDVNSTTLFKIDEQMITCTPNIRITYGT